MSESEKKEFEKLKGQCHNIFSNLYHFEGQSSRVYIRELMLTARCDEVYNFSDIRKSYADLVGTPAMKRITVFKETEEDERRAVQAVTHHSIWTTQHLESALTWPNWLWYQSVD